MSYQGMGHGLVRAAALGLAAIGVAAVMTGCVSHGTGGGLNLAVKSSKAEFDVAIDTTDPADKRIVVAPNEGDAWLEAVANPRSGENRIVWKSSQSFSIKFVQIDDQTRPPSSKFGDEGDGWNDAVRQGSEYKFKLTLRNGGGGTDRTIQGAKYLVKVPAGCDDSNPGPNCLVLDPVIIVRY